MNSVNQDLLNVYTLFIRFTSSVIITVATNKTNPVRTRKQWDGWLLLSLPDSLQGPRSTRDGVEVLVWITEV